MAYILKRIDQGGGYVAKQGRKNSYTDNLVAARKFRARKDAEKERCGNEIVEDLNRTLDRIMGED